MPTEFLSFIDPGLMMSPMGHDRITALNISEWVYITTVAVGSIKVYRARKFDEGWKINFSPGQIAASRFTGSHRLLLNRYRWLIALDMQSCIRGYTKRGSQS